MGEYNRTSLIRLSVNRKVKWKMGLGERNSNTSNGGVTLTFGNVAHVSIGAAVGMVSTTISVDVGTTSVLTIAKITASFGGGAGACGAVVGR